MHHVYVWSRVRVDPRGQVYNDVYVWLCVRGGSRGHVYRMCTCGHAYMSRVLVCVHVDVWSRVYMWRCGDVYMWTCGDVYMWTCGVMYM